MFITFEWFLMAGVKPLKTMQIRYSWSFDAADYVEIVKKVHGVSLT